MGVEEYFKEFDNFTINFLHPPASFTNDSCSVPRHHIVSEISHLTIKGDSRLLYNFQQKECSSNNNSGALWIHNNAPEIQGDI